MSDEELHETDPIPPQREPSDYEDDLDDDVDQLNNLDSESSSYDEDDQTDDPSPTYSSPFVSTKIHVLDGTIEVKMPVDTPAGDLVQFKKKYVDLNFQFTNLGAGLSCVLAYMLGALLGGGAFLAYYGTYWNLYLYIMFLGFFHFSEYICVALFNPKTLSSESFLLNHSLAYTIAMVSSFVEYYLELFLFPQWLVLSSWIIWPAFVVTFAGQALRLIALLTAQHNFTHLVAERKREEHVLVTTGVYGLVRHPGYCGWFWWSVAGQVLLVNPICAVGFAVASYSFFVDRIEYEEEHLVDFFGEDYGNHRKRVPTYIPFIK